MLGIFKKNKYKYNQKSVVFLIFFICLIYGSFFNATEVLAAGPDPIMVGIVTLLGWIAFFLSYVIGFIATVIIDVLIWVAQFNNIIGVDAVRQGWVIVRDLCNMFFILILLVIAFATILRIESYSAKRLLPKLLIMAVLINFSKTIFGLIIDFSQVIMLTFVNGFAATGTGHFVNMFQMNKYLSMEVSKQANQGGSALAVAAGILMGLFAMIISTIVILVLLVVLVFRIIMLWVYTILSPLVFFGAAFPGGQKYTSRIWEDFIKQVLVGPLLAFFIWLALLTAGTSSSQLSQQQLEVLKSSGQVNVGGQQVVTTQNSLFSTINFQSYVITIALLIGGLMVTQSIGGVAGSMAGKGMQWAKRAGMVGVAGALAPMKGGLKLGKNIGGWAVDKASLAVGADLNVMRGYKRLKAQMEINKESREAQVYGKAVDTVDKGGFVRSKLAHVSTGDLAWESARNWYKPTVLKRFWMGGKAFNEKRKKISEEIEGVKDQNGNVTKEGLKQKRERVMTRKERSKKVSELYNMRNESKQLAQEVLTQRMAVQTAPKDKLDEENKKLKTLQTQKKDIDDNIKLKEQELRVKIVDDKESYKLDDEIKLKQEEHKKLDKLEVSGLAAARAQSMAELESKEGKIISHIDNAQQLGMMFEDAIRNQRSGLAAAIAKKMTRNSDYNELLGHLSLGTGLKGLSELSKTLQKSGMSEQAALGVVGDMGAIGKGIGHFASFGAVTMDKGKLRVSNEEEYETAQLAEMLKLQPQNFGRNVNRLGLGYYDPAPGESHSSKNWKLSKAATAYIKLNGGALAKNWEQTGQQNALEHVYNHLDQLIENDVPQEIIDVLEKRTKLSKGRGADPLSTIRSIKS